ncbi:DUF2971 domain-containing protein [Photobacterium sp. J15]|uniref:DUF2971 domain-containing protein n=1 Tax=Photobacterium sp. J15 TaxID=265901 RepID=UPI000AEB013F|nr:DUF2971 domain-containing protein [Photobacterium sp. J15]
MEKFRDILYLDSDKRAGTRNDIHINIPDVLYHYTNTNGLLGILSSSRLWATHYKFLNDESEITYALGIFEKLVKEKFETITNPIVVTFLERVLQTANPFEGMFDCYITCFCEGGDLLAQWRSYTDNGGGYSIGVNSKELGMRSIVEHPSQELYLRKVTYCPITQEKLLRDVIDKTVSILDKNTSGMTVNDANSYIAMCCGHLRSEIVEYIISFKHPAFESEQEWRLCHIVATHEESEIEFRSGPYGLTPYVSIDPSPMAGVNANKLPIVEVKFGPTTNPYGAEFGLRKLLKSKGYAFADITGSNLPVRV